jgi:cytochrome c-type biogenesis protein CcmH/NrfF
VVNALVNWVWFGFGILALGTGIALLPERALSFASAKAGAAQAASAAVLVLGLVLGPAPLFAQSHQEGVSISAIAPRNETERRLYERLVCLCGSCGKEPIGTCTCSYAAGVRQEVAVLVDAGGTEDAIIAELIARYGSQELLGKPHERGFNRLAWLLPYMMGVSGLVFIGAMATRWSRRSAPVPQEVAPEDPALAERLDDELRNLD